MENKLIELEKIFQYIDKMENEAEKLFDEGDVRYQKQVTDCMACGIVQALKELRKVLEIKDDLSH